MNIVVIGMGYVGIPCAALLADVPGFYVTGVQRRSRRSGWKIDQLNAGLCPFDGHEPGMEELLHKVAVEKQSFRVTDDYSVCKDADVILIDVQTPTDGDHVPHYESLREVSAQAGRYLQPGTLVIVESTVAPGTVQHVVRPILEQASGLRAGRPLPPTPSPVHGRGGDDQPLPARGGLRVAPSTQLGGGRGEEGHFFLAFSYERVMPGKLLEYITDFPRVVGGIDEESTRRAVELYGHIVRETITPTDVLTAEMAKVIENAYRDVNIAFANEVAMACERMGVDMFSVRELINARPDRDVHLPGAGVGGHCLPKDSWLLTYGLETYGAPTDGDGLRIIPLAREVNDGMPRHMLGLIEDALAEAGRELAGSKVAVLGVAYLENADDTRNTPAVPLVRALQAGGADIVCHDPFVRITDWRLAWDGDEPAPLTQSLDDALAGADCAVVVTRHRAYVDIARANPGGDELAARVGRMRTPVLVDGRNVFDPRACAAAGVIYRGVGKGTTSVSTRGRA